MNFAGVTEEVAQQVVVGVGGLEREGETSVGVLGESLGGVVALLGEVGDDFLEKDFLEADFDLLGAEDAPGVGGELGDEEGLVGGLGGEVGEETGFELVELGLAFEGEDGELGG